jgi:hypothetical protein
MCSTGWFLTYPKLDMSHQEVLELLQQKDKAIKEYTIARELHKDGTPHFHVYIRLFAEFDCRDCRYWDLQGQHGYYETAKSPKKIFSYITKDGDYISNIENIGTKKEAADKKKSVAYLAIMKGKLALKDYIESDPILWGASAQLEKADAAYKRIVAASSQLPRCTDFIPNTFGKTLLIKSQKNRHYWFWSVSPNTGKTTFLQSIESTFSSFRLSVEEKFQANVVHGCQFVLIDEYSTGLLKITQLNQMCDGTYQYPRKGADAVSLPGSIVLVCGNVNPLEIYSEKHHPLIKARFEIFCLDV